MKTEIKQLKYGLVFDVLEKRTITDKVLSEGVLKCKRILDNKISELRRDKAESETSEQDEQIAYEEIKFYLEELRSGIDSLILQLRDDKERKGAKFLGIIQVDDNLVLSLIHI
eukprot:TRINITY_DN24190_c0_g1_i2.p4 TRINITY_DN24190_c0_g1~~TRINITY_DN24190_c0_g1_i2.p4  ORF type:complete len:113 (-),score=29.06 TRINITY_DN24190_c0_g1_i2:58-396(-)